MAAPTTPITKALKFWFIIWLFTYYFPFPLCLNRKISRDLLLLLLIEDWWKIGTLLCVPSDKAWANHKSTVNPYVLLCQLPVAIMYIPKNIYMKIKTYNNDYKTYNRENWKFDWKPELMLADWSHEYKWLKVWIIF